MLYKIIAVALIPVLLHSSLMAQGQSQSPVQTPAKMQQVLRKAQENDKAVKVTLNKKINNQKKLTGKASEISATGFTLVDQKTGAATKVAYEDVQHVVQKGLSRGWKIALLVIGGVIVAAVIFGEQVD